MSTYYFIDKIQDFEKHLDNAGFLRVKGKIARIGVQTYLKDDRLINVLRDESEVSATAASFSNQPITLDHPSERVVTAAQAKDQIKGYTGNTKYELGWVVADELVITHPDAIAAAQSSHQQLSAGYYADLIEQKGEWTDTYGVCGEIDKKYTYDYKQTNIVANHLALVKKARAGDDAKLNLDSNFDTDPLDYLLFVDNNYSTQDLQIKMDTKTNDNLSVQTDDITKKVKQAVLNDLAVQKEQETIKLENEAKDKKLAELDGAIVALRAENDSLKKELADLKQSQEKMVDSAIIATEIEERLALWDLTKDVIGDIDYTLDTVGIKKAFLIKKMPDLTKDIDTKPNAFVDGMFEVLKTSQTPMQKQKETIDNQKITHNDSSFTVADAFNARFNSNT